MKQQNFRLLHFLTCLALGVLLAVITISAAAAHERSQNTSGGIATLSDLDLSQFPQVSGHLRAYQADGRFADALEAEEVLILEGNQNLPIEVFDLQRPGVQFVLSVLGGSDLAFRNIEGFSRLDYLLQAIETWQIPQETASSDDLSLIIQGGTEILHQRDAAQWTQAVAEINEDSLRQQSPDLQILSRALAVAAAAPPDPGMGKALLVITPAVRASSLTGLQSLALTARQEGVRIYIWLVASQEYGNSILVNGLRLLAAESGGDFFVYSGSEDIPLLQNYLEPLRQVYRFSYTSAIRTTGVYTMAAEIQSDTLSQRTTPLEFAISISPPNPIFVGLPGEITRTVSTDNLSTARAGVPLQFEPDLYRVRILVELPDNIQRDIRQSSLLVNGQVAAVNLTAPYDQFEWDLTSYTSNKLVSVKVVVTDTLGLVGSSAEFPVNITVVEPPGPPPTAFILTPQGALAILLSAVALGAVVGLILMVSGRLVLIRNPFTGQARQVKRGAHGEPPPPVPKQSGQKASRGVSTKPIAKPKPPSSGLPGWMWRLQRPALPTGADAPLAYLTPITEGEDDAAPPLPINAEESILGSEITWTTWAIKDPSLAPIHARLRREGSNYRLLDENTVGGTWVNYTPVPLQGTLLAHGDAIHFGRVGFRFGLRSGSIKKPVITRLKTKYPL
jgi:hypothetical protein